MIYIPTVPCGYQQQFNRNYLIDFILLHKLIDNEDYRNYYLRMKTVSLNLTQYWILDNSAFELGESLDDELLIEWAERLGVHELVIPDVYGDEKATLDRFEKFMSIFNKKDIKLKLQAVPQGGNVKELLDCYVRFDNDLRVDVIGINKLWTAFMIDVKEVKRHSNKIFHKLGITSFKHWIDLSSTDTFRSADSRILSQIVTNKDDIWQEVLSEQQFLILKELIKAFTK